MYSNRKFNNLTFNHKKAEEQKKTTTKEEEVKTRDSTAFASYFSFL